MKDASRFGEASGESSLKVLETQILQINLAMAAIQPRQVVLTTQAT